MTLFHSLLVMGLSLLFIVLTLAFIIKGGLRIKYALIWLVIGCAAFFSPFFYMLAAWLHVRFNFPSPTIQLLMGAILLLALVCLQLTASISRAHRERRILAQQLALLAEKVNEPTDTNA